MKTQLAITDLTRMQHGHVCIAGYTTERQCVRLIQPPPGISETSLIADQRAIVFPFAVVECDLLEPRPDPPHTEDRLYDPASLCYVRPVLESRRKAVLCWSMCERAGDIFGQPVKHDMGHYVLEGQGARSLGTIRPRAIRQVEYKEGIEGAWDYRLTFKDADGWYNLKITDLTWHYFCDRLRGQGKEPEQIAGELTAMLKQREVYLRVGLSRHWKKFPERCFLQLNAIHTIPDYLEGRTFVDLVRECR
jgi:hypothetical protein